MEITAIMEHLVKPMISMILTAMGVENDCEPVDPLMYPE